MTDKEEKEFCPWHRGVEVKYNAAESEPNRVSCEYYRFDFTDGVSRCMYNEDSPLGGPCCCG